MVVEQNSGASVVAVVVTYNPPPGLLARFAATLSQVSHLIVVDNGSDAATQTLLTTAQTQHPAKLTLLKNIENKGLAIALNQGIEQARRQGADWVLLLDHDSTPQADMIACLLAAHARDASAATLGLIAPEIYDENAATPTRYLVPQGKWWFRRVALDMPTRDDLLTAITSGSLIPMEVFNAIGTMPEHFFIDYIDHDFCLRLKRHGYRILLVKGAILHHRLGEKTQHKLAGATLIASHHSALRRYYIFRNRLWIWKRYAMIFPSFIAHDVLAAFYDLLRIAFYETNRWRKFCAITHGLQDGLRRENAQGLAKP